jgi:hypothetical protein
MSESEFTECFPEWALSWSLKEVCNGNPRFWNWPVVHPTRAPNQTKKFSDLFPLANTPILIYEKPFVKGDWKTYGIPDEEYKKTFWSLRPDFAIEDNCRTLVLIEAKGGELRPRTWTNPKEHLYYDFLKKCGESIKNKGFYYIIPKKYANNCMSCLTDTKNFEPSENIQTGFICWESLLDLIYEKLIETMLDHVIFSGIEGLKKLRQWRGENPNPS